MTMNLGINKSKIKGNKKAILSFSLILILAIPLIVAFAQPALAQVGVPQPENTSGYIDVSPHLLGVGQQATVNLFIYPIPTNYAYQAYYDGYRGITVTFVRPDGTKDTFTPTDATGVYAAGQTQSLGAIYFFYSPTMAGNWSVTFTMPAQNLTDVSGTVQMSGCTSQPAYFTVQTGTVLAGLLNGYPWAQLPNSNVYWSYPISSNNREWNQISGDWLSQTSTGAIVNSATIERWQPYGTGPNTAHIVWDYSGYRIGGIIGGDYGSLSYGTMSTKENAYATVILDGKLYQNTVINVPSATTTSIASTAQFQCIDLATGKLLFTAPGAFSCGVHLPLNAFVQSGYSPTGNVVLESSYGNAQNPYLFQSSGTTWNWYDPLTGKIVLSMANASSAQLIDGSVLAFGVRGTIPNQTLFRWNMTSVVNGNWPTGITWQISLPKSLLDALPQYGGTTGINAASKAIFAVSTDLSTVVVKAAPNQFWGYSAATGASIWNLTINYPTTGNQEIRLAPVDDFIIFNPVTSAFECYSLLTGAHLWTSTSFSDNTWATTWTVYATTACDNNNLYSNFPDGTVRAYSLADGHEIWRSTPFASTEYPNNVVPYCQGPMVMVDGKIFVCAGYSSSYKINPIPRFGMVVCINATNGDNIYALNGGLRPSAAADGKFIGIGDFDGLIYALGKGTTSTTVTAQQQVGGSVLIQGSVLDKSPASSDAAINAMYPNGVPAVSDANMSVWMDYLHMQNSTLLNTPPACIGVPVSLAAVDPNGNSVNIGTVTSDGSGNFAYQWTPTTAGLYKVYATFGGSDSYFSSYAGTGATVATVTSTTTPAPTATSAPSNLATTADLMTYIVVGVIAMIIAIAIATVLILRKK